MTTTVDQDEACAACEAPCRMPNVTWRGVRLCGEHWRMVLSGRDDDDLALQIAMAAKSAPTGFPVIPRHVREIVNEEFREIRKRFGRDMSGGSDE